VKWLATILAVCLLFACGKPEVPREGSVLRIGWVQSLGTAPALIAEQKGYFRQEGLDVELKSFSDGPLIQQAMAAGQLDVAYLGGAPVFQWAQRGFDARMLAKVNSGHAALIVRAVAPVRSLEDLRGRRVAGTSRGSGMDVFLRGFVLEEQARLEPDKDVTVVNMPAANMPQAMAFGGVDAAFGWEPFISQTVLRGDARVLLDTGHVLPDHPWYVIAAPVRTLRARPEDMVRLLRAHHRAIAFLYAHPAEADAIIIRGLNIQPALDRGGHLISPEAVVHEARKRVSWSDSFTDSDIAFFQRMAGWSYRLGYLAQPGSVAALVDRSFARKAKP
jgi:NitT/TauT family transport system substrate-binding protein